MVELQLGLSLSSTNQQTIKGFDLNNLIYYEPKDTTTTTRTIISPCLENNKNKRSFSKAFDEENSCNPSLSNFVNGQKQTLPLLAWNDQPNEEEEDDHLNHNKKKINNQSQEDGRGIVGWPPIKTWRKKLHYHNQDGCALNEEEPKEGNGYRASNLMYVKVMMEGMPIGRKINLSLHQSYQTLTTTLINMFGKYEKSLKGLKDGGTNYTLTYQDKEGDWLLVGDVPWPTFIESVQRLKIVKDGC